MRCRGAMSNMWATPKEDPRTYGDPVGELATYREYLDNYRLTMNLKCEGLDADQLARRSVPPSTLSLIGLVRHLAQVENHWFQRTLQGRADKPRLYKRDDAPDWDIDGATPDPAVVKDQGSRHGVYSVVAVSRLACMFVAGGVVFVPIVRYN